MQKGETFIVGRQKEVELFTGLTQQNTTHSILNIYGPGGIGKTIVGQKIQAHARQFASPLAFVDGFQADISPIQILNAIKDELVTIPDLAPHFSAFAQQHHAYTIIQEIMRQGGGLQAMFTPFGTLIDREALYAILSSLGVLLDEEIKQIVSNRFALERYLRGAKQALTASLGSALETAVHHLNRPITILIDTYENMQDLDDWICRHFMSALPSEAKLLILGRNALPDINFDWRDWGNRLHAMPLPELPEEDAKTYLKHYGLTDEVALEQLYQFTGGYPLLLVLVVHLANEAGGWKAIGQLEQDADRDRVATKLLERILREERVQEVQAFLEKGVVARWFTPEIVSLLLEISTADGRAIYDKLAKHSFTERHQSGLKFHDKIRELLLQRLKFSNETEYARLHLLLENHFDNQVPLQQNVASPLITKSFGDLLQLYRQQSFDRKKEKPLTQARAAELLEGKTGIRYSGATISAWERDETKISIENRLLLIGLIELYHELGGLKTLIEANELCMAGGHSPLDAYERQKIFGSQ